MRATLVILLLLETVAAAAGADFTCPPGFLWGTATAAHQVEGNNSGCDWWDWEQVPGHIKNGDRSGVAVDHYRRYAEDLDLARRLNSNAYRFSVEWARVEPAEGAFDARELEHYRQVLRACHQRGITPFVTLFHFTLPRWAAAQGGFENPRIIDRFVRYARRVARELGPQVTFWCTENEPTVYVVLGYLAGLFPPGKKDLGAALRVYANLILAHARAYHAIRDAYRGLPGLPSPRIGIASHLRVFDPYRSGSPADTGIAWILDQVFNKVFFLACTRGWVTISVPGSPAILVAAPYLKGTMDYIGVNYYSRDMIRHNPASPIQADLLTPPGATLSELGWEIYPEGLYRTLMWVKQYGLPIYITENGVSDGGGTLLRDFLAQHLGWMGRAMQAGADVRGYFCWSLMDNFEWVLGFWPRFGLYRVDYATQERTPTAGARYYSEVAATGSISLPEEVFRP